MQSIEAIIINLVILAYVLYRQAVPRPVYGGRDILSKILLIGGAVNLFAFLSTTKVSAGGLSLTLGSLVVLAGGFAAVRAYTVKLWRNEDGIAYRRGTALTIALWIIAIALHAFVDNVSGTNSASLYLYFGITLTVQHLVVEYRARTLA